MSTTTAFLYLGLTRRLYVLTRGGAALRLRGALPLAYLDGLVFVGAEHGLAIGPASPNAPYRAAVTADGGRHWTMIGR